MNGITIADTLQSDFDMDDVLFENMVGCQDENVEKYLKMLPYLQRKIIKMKMENVSVSQIKEELGLSDKECVEQFNQIKSFNNIRTINQLFGNSSEYVGKEEEHKQQRRVNQCNIQLLLLIRRLITVL